MTSPLPRQQRPGAVAGDDDDHGGAVAAARGSSVTVVVITHDRRDRLLETLDRLTALPERPPVVVVDNASRDGTAAAVRERGDVTLVALGANVGAAGRDAGVAAAGTPLVAFADDDSWWAPGALRRAADRFAAHPRLGLLAAHVLDRDGEPDATSRAMAASPLPPRPGVPGIPVLGFLACGAVVRRAAYTAVGGFGHDTGVGGEEARLALDLEAAGWAVVHDPEVVAHHVPDVRGARPGRDARSLGSDLSTTWARRPLVPALRRTHQLLRSAPAPTAVRGVRLALRDGRRTLADRRPITAALERRVALVERAGA